jgi:hypothetical protein
MQLVRQALGVVSLLAAPSSHCSPYVSSTTLSPQLGSWRVVRHAFGAVSLLALPLSHASPAASFTRPSPHSGAVQSSSPGCRCKPSHK